MNRSGRKDLTRVINCQCEKDCHFGHDLKGNHEYLEVQPRGTLVQVTTPLGTMVVCQHCADTCLAMYKPKVEG